MVGQRLRQLRLARGMTLEGVAAEMGGIVTKQALSKYEHGKAQPSPVTLQALANVLGVRAAYLSSEPMLNVEFIAYRRNPSLSAKDKSHIEALVEQALEQRVRVQNLLGQHNQSQLPIRHLSIDAMEDTEEAAEHLRDTWGLGRVPISDVTATLEDHLVCVMEAKTSEDFDGLSAIARDDQGTVEAAAVVTRSDTAGDRQRLNLTHELGHLVLDIPDHLEEEKAAFRFGGAFLAPRESLTAKLGAKRGLVQTDELLLLKQEFGMSLQALVYRIHDLQIIGDSHYRHWWSEIKLRGWKKQEPLELKREQPRWLRRNALRLVSEGLISKDEAEGMIGESLPVDEPRSVIERRAFMKLPPTKRRQLLEEQASKIARQYQERQAERDVVQGGDIVEY